MSLVNEISEGIARVLSSFLGSIGHLLLRTGQKCMGWEFI